jgi:hypothetical protein
MAALAIKAQSVTLDHKASKACRAIPACKATRGRRATKAQTANPARWAWLDRKASPVTRGHRAIRVKLAIRDRRASQRRN